MEITASAIVDLKREIVRFLDLWGSKGRGLEPRFVLALCLFSYAERSRAVADHAYFVELIRGAMGNAEKTAFAMYVASPIPHPEQRACVLNAEIYRWFDSLHVGETHKDLPKLLEDLWREYKTADAVPAGWHSEHQSALRKLADS